MRMRKKPIKAASLLLDFVSHAVMGVAFGLAFAFALTHIPFLGVISYIDHSPSPREAMTALVGTCVTTFSIGATMTGLVLSKLRTSNSCMTWRPCFGRTTRLPGQDIL